MDFGFGGTGDKSASASNAPANNADGSQTTDLSTGQVANTANGQPADDINDDDNAGGSSADKGSFDNGDNSSGGNDTKGDDQNKPDKKPAGDDTTTTLVEGSTIELGDDKYTVDAIGNVVDKDGNVFKEAKDVTDWLASFDNVEDGDTALSIDNIQDVIGIEITDDNDKPIVFDNTPEGVKAYIDSVMEVSRDDIREETINTLYQKYPIISDVINYYIANGNSIEGFGEVQDRSSITIDDANEAQQESIIRTAWAEQGKRGDVETYINYLKSSGILLATAKDDLAALQEGDKEYRDQLRLDAEKAENDKIETNKNYWNSVKETIDSKKIAGYSIPDTIIRTIDGKKVSATPNDFYNYVYLVDKDGKSSYEKDLAKETPESRKEDELLRAYLRFSGGNYSNLVGMAVNKDKVTNLKVRANGRTTSSVKVIKPVTNQTKEVKDFGY